MPQRSFLQRTGFLWPCVGLASILTDDIYQEEDVSGHRTLSLREEASYEGLTYIQVLKYLERSGLYLACVACSPLLLGESDLLVFFTEEQLSYTLPVDVRLQQKRPEDIISAIKAHAATLLPACATATSEWRRTTTEKAVLSFHPLAETIEVTREDLTVAMQAAVADQKMIQHTSTSPTRAAHLLQQALLRAALDVLMRQLWQTPRQARSQRAQARCRLLAALQRWQEKTRQRVVVARAIWNQALGEVVWELTVGVPILLG